MMNSPMNDDYVAAVLSSVGFEQILIDANMTVEDVAMILDTLGYIELDIYLEIEDEDRG